MSAAVVVPKGKILKYGLLWPEAQHPLKIEMYMIEKGGKWGGRTGNPIGNGLAYHMKAGMKIIWPELIWHKWFDMFNEAYVAHRTIAVMGPASSGKSLMASAEVLFEWMVFPTQTTVIVTSTTMERLQDRIWGEIKSLHSRAIKRFRWLPGHLIDSRLRIIADKSFDPDEAKDFRNGIVGVPCFPSKTLIDTPAGRRPIEDLRVGDVVLNACGCGRITQTHSRFSPSLVRVKLSDGRYFDCTDEHPILTQRGWVAAIDVETLDMVFSAHETLSILRRPAATGLSEQEILRCSMSRAPSRKAVRTVSETVSTVEPKGGVVRQDNLQILQPSLCKPLDRRESKEGEENKYGLRSLREGNKKRSQESVLLLSSLPQSSAPSTLRAMRGSVHVDSRVSQEDAHSFLQRVLQEEMDDCSLPEEAGFWNAGRIGRLEAVPGFNIAIHPKDRPETFGWEGALVSNRHCVSRNQVGCRDRRWGSPHPGQAKEGYNSHFTVGKTWVESVEVLKQEGDERFDVGQGGYRVHNISVEGHPSYSVNGVIVHNCLKGTTYVGMSSFVGLKNKRVRHLGDELSLLPRAFVDSISNLDKNPDFKGVGLGNPKETTDAMGVLAEPAPDIGGWDGGIDQVATSKVWKTRRPDGCCVQLVGSDSPNLDGKLGIPLLTQEQINRDIAFYGKDSLQYTMMNQGMMPRGQGSRRVLTRQECEKHHAKIEPRWLNSNRTKIWALDAAYAATGGDRCVLGFFEFGEEMPADEDLPTRLTSSFVNQPIPDHQKRMIFAQTELLIVPISAIVDVSAPDQIVDFVRVQCMQRNCTPENGFYDAGMRTALVQSFARLWSNKVNSVDFGGKPTEQNVSHDEQVKCVDRYSKFVTELWYSVRHVVIAKQYRGMTEDVIMEFAQREWTIVGANKIEVEPKSKMKEKSGRSPDLADTVALGVYAARQRGFIIKRLKSPIQEEERDFNWKRELRQKASSHWRSGQLTEA